MSARDSMEDPAQDAQVPPANRRKWRWIGLAGGACAMSWAALATGIALKADTATMLVLASLAAVTTEGTVWLAALLLGVSVYQARRQLWRRLRRRFD